MKDFLFYAAVYGAAASIALLHVGYPIRHLAAILDQKLFPSLADSPARGGPIKVLVHCPACLSFWIALIMSTLVYSPSGAHFGIPTIPRLLVDSISATGIIFIVHVVMTRLGQYDL